MVEPILEAAPRTAPDLSTRRLRVLLMGPLPPPMGGIVRYAQDMLGSDLARQHNLTLFQDNIPFDWRPRSATERHSWNIVKRDGIRSTAKVLAFVAARAFALDRTLRRERHDVLHVLSTAGLGFFRNSLHIWIARRRGVKTVFHLLGQIDDLYREARPRVKRLISRCLDLADVHIVQSPLLAEFVRRITVKEVFPIFNGVRIEEFAGEGPPPPRLDGWTRVVCLGVLGHKKGTFDLLEAAARLKARDRKVRFTFVGAGEVERFRNMASAMSIADRVEFLGPVEDPVRVSILKASDIFALPSHAEGQPIALLEALAAGLPVVASTVGSIPEVVGERNGFLVEPGEVGALVERLEELADRPELRRAMGLFNAGEARERYRIERVMREIDAVYAGLFG